jgi:hypothetical protein
LFFGGGDVHRVREVFNVATCWCIHAREVGWDGHVPGACRCLVVTLQGTLQRLFDLKIKLNILHCSLKSSLISAVQSVYGSTVWEALFNLLWNGIANGMHIWMAYKST